MPQIQLDKETEDRLEAIENCESDSWIDLIRISGLSIKEFIDGLALEANHNPEAVSEMLFLYDEITSKQKIIEKEERGSIMVLAESYVYAEQIIEKLEKIKGANRIINEHIRNNNRSRQFSERYKIILPLQLQSAFNNKRLIGTKALREELMALKFIREQTLLRIPGKRSLMARKRLHKSRMGNLTGGQRIRARRKLSKNQTKGKLRPGLNYNT